MSSFPLIKIAGIYYWNILEAIQQDRRIRVPALNESNPLDPLIQLERSFALASHFNCVLIDLAGNECLLPTLQRRVSAQHLLRLLGRKLKGATPSSSPLLLQLSAVIDSDITGLIKKGHLFATAEGTIILFEYLGEDFDLERTDRCSGVYGVEDGTESDYTSQANTPGSYFYPWSTPVKGDALYIGHNSIVFDRVDISFNTPGSIIGMWEYYDPSYRINPDEVTKEGDALKFKLNSLFGTSDRSGATVRVVHIATGNYEDVEVTWDGSYHIAETSWLVPEPATEASDYYIYPTWAPVEVLEDTLSDFSADGYVRFSLPIDEERDWGGSDPFFLLHESYWLRFRVVSVTSNPQLDEVKIYEGDQFIKIQVTQGETRTNEFVGTGEADQRFKLTRPNTIEGSISVAVEELAWSEVESFIESGPSSRDYTLEFEGDFTNVVFGDGSLGYPPQLNDDIAVEYRTGAEEDGNVGTGAISTDQSGTRYVSRLWNPRPATGWAPPEGSTVESLNLLKLSAPREFRAIDRAVSAQDAATLAEAFVSLAGSTPVKRAIGVEERYGPKTIGVIVVGTGGIALDTDTLEEIQNYLNEKSLANTQITVENYQPYSIDIDMDIEGGNSAVVAEYIRQYFNPLLLMSDGEYRWSFGEEISIALISSLAFDADPEVVDVKINSPTSNIELALNELPVAGTITVGEL